MTSKTCSECGCAPVHWNHHYCRECGLRRGNPGDFFFEVDIDKVKAFFKGDEHEALRFVVDCKRDW
jgi:hypothetical protein